MPQTSTYLIDRIHTNTLYKRIYLIQWQKTQSIL